jgi:hypothetical protein
MLSSGKRWDSIIINIIIITITIIGGAVLSPWVSVQVPRYLLVPGTAATLAYCTNPVDWWGWFLEKLVEWKLAGETEVLGEKCWDSIFINTSSHIRAYL